MTNDTSSNNSALLGASGSLAEKKDIQKIGETRLKHPGGRPTKYTPAIIEALNEYLAEAVPENMKIPTVEGIALKLGITKETLYEWGDKYPEFSYALKELKMKQKQALIETGIFGGKEINANIVALLLKVNHKMIEKSEVDMTSKGEKIEPLQVVLVEAKAEVKGD